MRDLPRTAAPALGELERLLIEGDLSRLSEPQRVEYALRMCASMGLNPLTQPLQYLRLSGKLVLYVTRGATDQLRQLHGISIAITARERLDDIYIVTARATTPEGRCDEATGAVAIGGLRAEALANAYMRAETKARRRVTLSIVGLSLLDDSELPADPPLEQAAMREALRPAAALPSPAPQPQQPARNGNGAPPPQPHPAEAQLLRDLADIERVDLLQQWVTAMQAAVPEHQRDGLRRAFRHHCQSRGLNSKAAAQGIEKRLGTRREGEPTP